MIKSLVLFIRFAQQRRWICVCLVVIMACSPALAQLQNFGTTATAHLPTNLTECIEQLKKKLSKEMLDRLRSAPTSDITNDYHFTTGLWIRNEWCRNGPMGGYFADLGIITPDDMSAIILTSLWRDLHSQPIKLDEQIREYVKLYSYDHPQITERRSILNDVWNKRITFNDGRTMKLADIKGKPIILLFFATDPSDPAVISLLNSLRKQYSESELQIIGMGYEPPPYEQSQRERFMRNNPLFPYMFEILRGFTIELANSLTAPGAIGTPEIVLIGRDGNMITRFHYWDPENSLHLPPELLTKKIIATLKLKPKVSSGSKPASSSHSLPHRVETK